MKARSLKTKEEPMSQSESESRKKLKTGRLKESSLIREGSAFLFYSSL